MSPAPKANPLVDFVKQSMDLEDAAEIAGWGKDPAGVGFLNLVWRSKEQHVLVRAWLACPGEEPT